MPVIDTRVLSQELGEHLNVLMARSVDHRALETLAVGQSHTILIPYLLSYHPLTHRG